MAAEPPKIIPDALEGGGESDEDNDVRNVLGGTEFLWQIIFDFIKNLSEEDIMLARREFCSCVKTIIGAYEEKVNEVKKLRNNIKELERETRRLQNHSKNKDQIIKQLKEQLASVTCKECLALRFKRSLQFPEPRENEEASLKPGRENEEAASNDQTDYGFAKVKDSFVADIRCPHAPCGFVALLCALNKKSISFCPTKFLLKLGRVTRHEKPTCTNILNHLKGLRFIKCIYKCQEIKEGEHDEVLKIVRRKLNESGKKVGLLSYSTTSYNHCVTVYLDGSATSEEPQLKICDAHLKREDIKDLEKVRSFELIILKYSENGVAKIVEEWGRECNSALCWAELSHLSKPNHLVANAPQDIKNPEL